MGKGRFQPDKILRAAARKTAEEAFQMMECSGSIDRDESRTTLMRNFIRGIIHAKDTNSPVPWPIEIEDVQKELEALGASIIMKEIVMFDFSKSYVPAWEIEGMQITISSNSEGKGILQEFVFDAMTPISETVSMSIKSLVRIMKNIDRWSEGIDDVLRQMEVGVEKRFMETRMIKTAVEAALSDTPHYLMWEKDEVRISIRMKDRNVLKIIIKDKDIPEKISRVVPAVEALEKVREDLGVSFEIAKVGFISEWLL